MLAKAIFDKCSYFTWDHFTTHFRKITDENIDLVAQMYGWRDAAEMGDELQTDIRGQYACIAADEMYTENGLGPQDPVRLMINAAKALRLTEKNVDDAVLYESVDIFWVGGNPSRVFTHTILEYMEPEGEGDMEFEQSDWERIHDGPYMLAELIEMN